MPLIEFKGCDLCSLKKEWPILQTPRMPLCFPIEPSDVRVVFIGEGPGGDEDVQGRPFVGRTGQYLRDRLPKEWINKVFWQNVVRCRPPNNRAPSPSEISCCSVHLNEDLIKAKPHVVLGIGDVALNYFWPEQNITDMRGVKFPIQIGNNWTWFYSIFHPSHVVRSTRKNENNEEVNYVDPVFRADIRKFFNNINDFLTPPVVETKPEVIYPRSKEECFRLFERLEEPFGLDIEVFRKKPYLRDARLLTAAMSDGKLTFAFPVQWPGMISQWGYEFFVEAMKRKRRWIAHGTGMELPWVWYHTKEHEQYFDDTICLGRVYHNKRGILTLAEQTRIHLGIDIKELTKVRIMSSPDYFMHRQREILEYNGYDAWGCAKLRRKITLPADQEENYQRLLRTTKSCVYMELKGLNIDINETVKFNKDLDTQLTALVEKSKTIPEVQRYEAKGKKFAISSPQVVGEVLVDYCGLKLPKTAHGQYSTDDGNLQEYADSNLLVRNTLDYREVAKLKSTYVDPILLGKILGIDNLLHPSFKPLGTITGRTSSEDPNFQNFPKRKHGEIRRQIVAPPGYIFAAFDYGQLEARILAMASSDPALMKFCIQGEDIHSYWLNRVVKKYPLYMDRLREKTGQVEEKKIRKAGRDIIKTDFVFATFYGSVPPSVSRRTMVPLNIATELIDTEFWPRYAGVKRWCDSQFEYYRETGTVKTLTNFIRDEVVPGNEPINTAIQGTAAHVVIEAMIALFEMGLLTDIYLCPRWNIHDDLGFLLPDNNDTSQYIQTIAGEMVKPRFKFITVPLVVEVKVGYNWWDMEEVAKIEGAYIQ